MKNNQILKYINQYRSEIIKKLTADEWLHFKLYFLIRGNFLKNNLDDQFKKDFCRFYVMNGARGLNEPQKKKFFKLLLIKKINLENILCELYEIPGYGDRHKLFLSFGTKLLHTINEKLPIYDGNTAYVLGLSVQTYPVLPEERIKNRIDIYNELKNRFNVLLVDVGIRNYLKSIRQELQSKAGIDKFYWQDKYISDTKLLDSLLWALGPILKENKKLNSIASLKNC